MAKALLGHMYSDQRFTARQAIERLVAENGRLRERAAELEDEVARLRAENETLVATSAPDLIAPVEEMQPV